MDNEAWIMALEVAADAVYRLDDGNKRGEDWNSYALQKTYVALRKEIVRLENLALQEDE